MNFTIACKASQIAILKNTFVVVVMSEVMTISDDTAIGGHGINMQPFFYLTLIVKAAEVATVQVQFLWVGQKN